MRQFRELSDYEKTVLLVRIVQLLAEGDTYKSVEEIAAASKTSPRLLWLKICAEEHFDACEPWSEFPCLPKEFSAAVANNSPFGMPREGELTELELSSPHPARSCPMANSSRLSQAASIV